MQAAVIQNNPFAPSSSIAVCRHCKKKIKDRQSSDFCCSGCETVYHLIKDLNLNQYYTIRAQEPPTVLNSDPQSRSDFSLYDSDEISKKITTSLADHIHTVSLSIDGITCYACTWLIEHAIPRAFPGSSVKVNAATNEIKLTYDPLKNKLSEIISYISGLGYNIFIDDKSKINSKLRQSEIIRLGISSFCAMNVMVLAISNYVSPIPNSDQYVQNTFDILSIFFSSIVITYCAWPFYRSSWNYAKLRRINIDQPIC